MIDFLIFTYFMGGVFIGYKQFDSPAWEGSARGFALFMIFWPIVVTALLVVLLYRAVVHNEWS